jgi:hypothetical protein
LTSSSSSTSTITPGHISTFGVVKQQNSGFQTVLAKKMGLFLDGRRDVSRRGEEFERKCQLFDCFALSGFLMHPTMRPFWVTATNFISFHTFIGRAFTKPNTHCANILDQKDKTKQKQKPVAKSCTFPSISKGG